MTSEQYSDAYVSGFDRTVGLLMRCGVRRKQDAQDFAQEAWLKGWIRRDQIRDPKVIVAWVSTIALNVYREYWRHHDVGRDALLPVRSPDEWLPAGYPTSEIDTLSIDRRKLMHMVPVAERELMRDYYVDGYSGPELSERWGANLNTIKVRIKRSSDRLQKQVCPA
jgi:RNA polymerase sigma factor (sigma-70 family)